LKIGDTVIGKIIKKIVIIALIVFILCLAFIFMFRIKTINIEGSTRFSDEEIMEMVNLNGDMQNTILYYIKNKDLVIDNVAFIESISINWSGPNTISVFVAEKKIAGCIEVDGIYLCFDSTGEIIESSTTRQAKALLVDGLTTEAAALGDVIEVADQTVFKDLLILKNQLSEYELEPLKVVIRKDMSMVLHFDNVRVMMGNNGNLPDKIAAIKDLQAQLEGRKGILHLENYDSTKDSIIFSEES